MTLNIVAERHSTTATSDATGDQPKEWRATTQEPIGDAPRLPSALVTTATTKSGSHASCQLLVQVCTKRTRILSLLTIRGNGPSVL